VAGGLVPRAWGRSVKVTGASATSQTETRSAHADTLGSRPDVDAAVAWPGAGPGQPCGARSAATLRRTAVFQVHGQESCIIKPVDVAQPVVKLQAVQPPGAVIKVEDGTSQHVAVAIDNAPGALPGGQQRLPPVEETQRSALKPARCMVTENGITPPVATLRTGHGYRCSERLLTLPGADK